MTIRDDVMSQLRPTVEVLRAMIPFLASTAAMLSGYDVMKRTGLTKQVSYSIMHRLTRAGWLSERTERSNVKMGMPPRTLYEVTPQGEREARAMLSLLRPST